MVLMVAMHGFATDTREMIIFISTGAGAAMQMVIIISAT
jgi:hypothetical protein